MTKDENWKRHADGRGGTWIPYRIWRGKDTDTRTIEVRVDELLAWADKQRRTSFAACRNFADTFWMHALPIIRLLKIERQIVAGEVPVEQILIENEWLRKALQESWEDADSGEYRPALRTLMNATAFVEHHPEAWPDQAILVRVARDNIKIMLPEFTDAAEPPAAEPSSGAAALPEREQSSPSDDGSNLLGAG